MKHVPLSKLLEPPPPEQPHASAEHYDWFHCYGWKSNTFRNWTEGKAVKRNITFGDRPPLSLGYATYVLASYDPDYVFEGIEFQDGTCLVAWTISEFTDTFHSNAVSVWYFVLKPRTEPHRAPKARDSYRREEWIPVQTIDADGGVW